jgi:hypothetical protein
VVVARRRGPVNDNQNNARERTPFRLLPEIIAKRSAFAAGFKDAPAPPLFADFIVGIVPPKEAPSLPKEVCTASQWQAEQNRDEDRSSYAEPI